MKMADERYDVSPEQKEILLERAKRRTALRNEFQKQLWDPHRHASMEGGYVVSSWGQQQWFVFEVMLRYETRTEMLSKKRNLSYFAGIRCI